MMTLAKSIKNLLKNHQIRPSKRYGQNFLIDKNVLRKILKAADIKPGETILEIGPGTGILTAELAKKAKKVIAIEKDHKMAEILNEVLKKRSANVKIIKGDILKSDIYQLASFLYPPYKVVANLPYYLTSSFLRKFLEYANLARGFNLLPQSLVLIIQKEVAQRICSKSPKMNLLAVSVQYYAEPKIISFVSKNSFWPKPKVDSAIIRIVPRKNLLFSNPALFFRIVKSGFSQPRKIIGSNLAKGLGINQEKNRQWLLENNIQPTQRPETLSLNDWLNLAKTFKI